MARQFAHLSGANCLNKSNQLFPSTFDSSNSTLVRPFFIISEDREARRNSLESRSHEFSKWPGFMEIRARSRNRVSIASTKSCYVGGSIVATWSRCDTNKLSLPFPGNPPLSRTAPLRALLASKTHTFSTCFHFLLL